MKQHGCSVEVKCGTNSAHMGYVGQTLDLTNVRWSLWHIGIYSHKEPVCFSIKNLVLCSEAVRRHHAAILATISPEHRMLLTSDTRVARFGPLPTDSLDLPVWMLKAEGKVCIQYAWYVFQHVFRWSWWLFSVHLTSSVWLVRLLKRYCGCWLVVANITVVQQLLCLL